VHLVCIKFIICLLWINRMSTNWWEKCTWHCVSVIFLWTILPKICSLRWFCTGILCRILQGWTPLWEAANFKWTVIIYVI
jgi:hypothetical protein